MRGPWRVFACALVLGAAMRLGSAFAYWRVQPSVGGDDAQYLSLASSLAAGEGYLLKGAPSAYRAPLFPLFLSAGIRLGFQTPGALRLWQAAFSLLGIILAFLIGRRLHSTEAGAWGALALALHPEAALLPVSLYSESFYSVAALGAAWALVRWRQAPTEGNTALLGLSLGLTLLTRSILAPLPLLLIAWRRKELGPTWALGREALILLLAALIPLLPWIARNAVRFGKFIPFESGVAGPVVWYASQGYSTAPEDEASVEPLRTMYATMPHTEWDSFSLGLALQAVEASPLAYLLGCGRRLLLLWSDAYLPYLLHEHPDMVGLAVPPRWERACWIDHALRAALIALAALGALGARRRGFFSLCAMAMAFGVYALGAVFARFFAPVTPLLCVLAGPALARLTARER